MRIGLDARAAFLDPERGFGRVTRELADALLAVAPGQVVVFVPHGAQVPAAWYPLAGAVVQLSRPRRGAFVSDGPAWAWTLRRHPVDVLHLPAWGVPPGIPVPVVATFHDATPFRFPSPPRAWQRHRLRAAVRSLRRADLVHAVSQSLRGRSSSAWRPGARPRSALCTGASVSRLSHCRRSRSQRSTCSSSEGASPTRTWPCSST